MATVQHPESPDYGPAETRDGRIEEPENNAKQGISGQNVRWVLRFGVAGIVIVFVILYLVYF
jgi:hypothetical protein